MQLNVSSRLKRSYKRLPRLLQADFDRKVQLFVADQFDQKLRTHKLKGKLQECHAFCLRDGFRVLFEFVSNVEVNLLDVGPHNKYDRWG